MHQVCVTQTHVLTTCRKYNGVEAFTDRFHLSLSRMIRSILKRSEEEKCSPLTLTKSAAVGTSLQRKKLNTQLCHTMKQ